jgi:DNA-directed RNA polymerase subunit alpha
MNINTNKKIYLTTTVTTYKLELHYVVKIQNIVSTMGNTIGNLLRRVLLTQIPGTSVQGFTITGLKHNFDYGYNISKDADQISSTFRDVILYYQSQVPEFIETTIVGPKKVLAKEIFQSHAIDGEAEMFEILDDTAITVKIFLTSGVGFIPYYKHKLDDGIISVTSILTHNYNVSFDVIINNINSNYENITLKFMTYNTFKDQSAPLRYALNCMTDVISNIYSAIDYVESEKEESSINVSMQVEEVFQILQSELVSYLYENCSDIHNVESLLLVLKNIPDKTIFGKTKLKKKEIQNAIKLLTKLIVNENDNNDNKK